MEPTTKKWKNRKTKKVKTDTLRGNGKQSGESVESVMKKKGMLRWEGFAELNATVKCNRMICREGRF